MRSEYWSWAAEMRDAHLWLVDDGKLVMSWGWCSGAHLLPLRDLEDALDKSDAVIAIVGVDDDDQEMYRLWGDRAVDVVVVSYRGYIGIFRPAHYGARREYYTGVTVETPGRHWWLSDGDGVVAVALAWPDLLAVLAGDEDEE